MLVSIVIPVYNAQKYVGECLDSVCKQSYKNLEIIIINDGSTDNSLDVCEDYLKKDKRIKLINKRNEGLSKARQLGLGLIKGEYFATIDADDILEPDFIELMVEAVIEDESDICLCAREAFDERGSTVLLLEKVKKEPLTITMQMNEKKYADLAEAYQMSDSWNKLYRTAFVKSKFVSWELNRKYNGTDLLFNHLLLLHCPKISNVNKVLYHYRIVENSIVRKKNKPLQEGFEFITKRLLREASSLNYSELMINQVYLVYLKMLKTVNIDIVNECNRKERFIRLNNCVLENIDFVNNSFKPKDIGVADFKYRAFSWVSLNKRGGILLYIYYAIRDLRIKIIGK